MAMARASRFNRLGIWTAKASLSRFSRVRMRLGNCARKALRTA
jgi:hypothetical protein